MSAIPLSERLATHSTLSMDRYYAAKPEAVFHAWGREDAHQSWHVPGDDWKVVEAMREFRIGGRDYSRFGPPENPNYHSEGRFLTIRANELIVSAGTMHDYNIPTASTLCTVELHREGDGTRLVLTDQSVYFGECHSPEARRQGWLLITKNLELLLQNESDE